MTGHGETGGTQDRDAGSAATDAELLELRLRVAQLEADLEDTAAALARRSALLDALDHRRRRRVLGRAGGVVRAIAPDVLVARGYDGSGAAGVRIPLAGLPATTEPAQPLRWTDALNVGGVSLPAIEVVPPSSLRFAITGAGAAHVRAFAALRPASWLRNRGGARFRIALLAADGTVLGECSRDVDPAQRRADRRWCALVLPLPAHDGDGLVLELSTSVPAGGSPDYCWAVWGDPVVLATPAGARAVPVPRGLAAVRAATARREREAPASPPPGAPTISLLLPVHDPPAELLRETLDSVLAQGADGWQLCVADDGSRDPAVRAMLEEAARDARVTLARHDEAQGIAAATNLALASATGEYVATLDHDDLLAPDALRVVRARLAADPGLDVLYSDNDKVAARGVRFAPSLKPGWSPDLLRACMYTLHLGVYRRSLVEQLGGWRSAFDGAQDHDLLLRLAERTDRIAHVPRTLYSWRAHAGSAALGDLAKPLAYDRAAAAITEHLGRLGIPAHAERLPIAGRYRVVYEAPPAQRPTVVLPLPDDLTREAGLADRLAAVVAALRGEADVVLVTTEATRGAAAGLGDAARIVPGGPGPWGTLAVAGLAAADAVVVVLLEELCAPLGPGWAGELVHPLAEAGTVATSPLVLDAAGNVVAAGVALPRGLPLPVHPGAPLAGDHPPDELTMVTDRSAAAGVVAVTREALGHVTIDPAASRAGLAQLTAALTRGGGRVVCSPHAPWQVSGTPRTRTVDLEELRRVARADSGRQDPFYNPRYWPDRASHLVPTALRLTGGLAEIDLRLGELDLR